MMSTSFSAQGPGSGFSTFRHFQSAKNSPNAQRISFDKHEMDDGLQYTANPNLSNIHGRYRNNEYKNRIRSRQSEEIRALSRSLRKVICNFKTLQEENQQLKDENASIRRLIVESEMRDQYNLLHKPEFRSGGLKPISSVFKSSNKVRNQLTLSCSYSSLTPKVSQAVATPVAKEQAQAKQTQVAQTYSEGSDRQKLLDQIQYYKKQLRLKQQENKILREQNKVAEVRYDDTLNSLKAEISDLRTSLRRITETKGSSQTIPDNNTQGATPVSTETLSNDSIFVSSEVQKYKKQIMDLQQQKQSLIDIVGKQRVELNDLESQKQEYEKVICNLYSSSVKKNYGSSSRPSSASSRGTAPLDAMSINTSSAAYGYSNPFADPVVSRPMSPHIHIRKYA